MNSPINIPVNNVINNSMNKPIVWSIAGSDGSGGAGIQADNLTFNDFGVHGCNVITAITAQNSASVSAISCVDEAMLENQWQSLESEYPANVLKLGMLGSAKTITFITQKLSSSNKIVICDPVFKATNGGELIDNSAAYLELLSQVDILTPNISEFKKLFNLAISSSAELSFHALEIAKKYAIDLIVTGGDNELAETAASDLCVISGELFWLHSPFVETKNTHGTGCSFSSAITAAIALGYTRIDACVLAKTYINQGLNKAVNFASAKGPFQHSGFPQDIAYLPSIALSSSLITTQFPRLDTLKLGLYPVVDTVEWLERCLQEGLKTVQLRVKNHSEEMLDNLIEQATMLGRIYQARVFINDYWQLAIQHNAYGVHLGQEDLALADLQAIQDAGLHLGISTHSWFEIARAHSYKPSYIAIGPIFATQTKIMNFAPQGIQQLTQWVNFIGDNYPIVAIGGIDSSNAQEVLATGVGSIAMVRAITAAADYRLAIQQFQSNICAAEEMIS